MKFKFSLALLLSAIILASSASAALISTSAVGGVESDSQNGGTAGLTGQNYVNYYQAIAGQPGQAFQLHPTGAQSYLNELTEYVAVSADVADGHIGKASASFDTQTAQPFTFTNPQAGGSSSTGWMPATTTTSLNGAISVAVTKTKTDGTAHADAYMLAESGADPYTIGTETSLHATDYLSGVGSAVAEVKGGYASATALYGLGAKVGSTGTYSNSKVLGNIKLTASNVDDNPLASDGGVASGLANIESASYMINDQAGNRVGVGAGMTDETMILHANRGPSYTGKSYADGSLSGLEFTESQLVLATIATPVVDIESNSTITGSVVALNTRDIADMTAYLRARANITGVTYVDSTSGSDSASVDWNVVATAVRDTPYDGTAKVEANGFMPVAQWISSATTTWVPSYSQANGIATQRFALVKGNQGLAWDGVPAVNKGFGVGAWILNSYNAPQSAQMQATQTADTQPAAGTAKTTFQMTLNGMPTLTGTQKDAVGAFGAVANQFVQVQRVGAASPTGPAISLTLKPLDTNAINWIVGDNVNLWPGFGKESPLNMVFTQGTNSGIQRTATLTYNQP